MVDFSRNVGPNRAGSEHIPPQPLWLAIIRIIQSVFNVLVLSLAAHAASYHYLNGYGMAFFTVAWTMLFLLYVFLTPRSFPHYYHYWGHIGFEALTTLFYLVTFALLADYTRAWSGSWYGIRFRFRNGMTDSTNAAMAFALLNWLLFCVTLAASLLLSRRARADGTTSHAHAHSQSDYTTDPSTTATPTTGAGGGFKFSSLGGMFSRKNKGTDVEKNTVAHNGAGGAVNETGQPVELNDRPGYNNGVEQGGYGNNGGYGDPTAQHPNQYPNYPPPAAGQPEGRY